jgi:hypothetical protein
MASATLWSCDSKLTDRFAQIVGELGKLLVEEIPLEETPPGYGRAPYHGFEQTDRLANEAARCVRVA